MSAAASVSELWLSRLREGRVSYVTVAGLHPAQRGDEIVLEVQTDRQDGTPPLRIGATVTDSTVVTIGDDRLPVADRVVCTIISVKLLG